VFAINGLWSDLGTLSQKAIIQLESFTHPAELLELVHRVLDGGKVSGKAMHQLKSSINYRG
jgi:hypothetical protein